MKTSSGLTVHFSETLVSTYNFTRCVYPQHQHRNLDWNCDFKYLHSWFASNLESQLEISCSRGRKYEDDSLLGCYRPDYGGGKHFWNVDKILRDCTEQHHRRQSS